MRSAKNRVIAGKYEDMPLLSISGDWRSSSRISAKTVDHYEVLDQESAKSMSSAITRGLVGGAILGPIGVTAATTAKAKSIWTVVVYYKNCDEKSMLEMDDKTYHLFLNQMF